MRNQLLLFFITLFLCCGFSACNTFDQFDDIVEETEVKESRSMSDFKGAESGGSYKVADEITESNAQVGGGSSGPTSSPGAPDYIDWTDNLEHGAVLFGPGLHCSGQTENTNCFSYTGGAFCDSQNYTVKWTISKSNGLQAFPTEYYTGESYFLELEDNIKYTFKVEVKCDQLPFTTINFSFRKCSNNLSVTCNGGINISSGDAEDYSSGNSSDNGGANDGLYIGCFLP